MTTDVHTLLGAYVLDAVDDLERMTFDRHLRDCADCQAEVTELTEVAARLADGAWSVPPPRLREDVLARVARTRQAAPHSPATPVRRMPRRLLLSAAAAVVVAAVGSGTAVWAVQDQRVRVEQSSAESARSSEARVRDILAAPDLVLREKAVRGGGRVTVASSKRRDAGLIMLAASAAPAGDRVFQLWTVRSTGAAHSEKVLDPGQSQIVQVVEGMADAAAVGVSVEPRGGSRLPTPATVTAVALS